ncbi:permease-like cell division protein FtsX [Streptomyces tanashiensis]
MKDYWYDKVNVSIFLCNKSGRRPRPPTAPRARSPTEQKDADTKTDLKKMDDRRVRSSYESHDDAYKRYKEQYGDSPLIASVVTPDQMQESYRIKLKDPEKYKVVATAFAGRDGVESVQDQRNILQNLFDLMNGMNIAALGVMGLMLVIALMLIVNTVRVSAFSRRRETGIMRLVGASSFYIQMPFIMEAAFAGLLGGAVACVLLLVGRYFLIDHGIALAEKMQLVNFIGWDAVLAKLPLVIAIGLLMPAVAAFIALRKYLKV